MTLLIKMAKLITLKLLMKLLNTIISKFVMRWQMIF